MKARTSHPDTTALLPEPGTLRIGPPPHCQGTPGLIPITMTFALAATVVAASGLVLFGSSCIRVIAISVAVSLLVESLFDALRGQNSSWSESNALLIGLLFGCTLPATASWRVVLTGALIAVAAGTCLPGGMGNYIWHPVALGRVAVQLLFSTEVTPKQLPVLGPGQLLWGSLDAASPLRPLTTWGSHPLPSGVGAWLVRPVADMLRAEFARTGNDPASGLAAFVRDAAPPWRDTLTGVAGGAIGEACGAAILVAAGLLIWRGFLRWPMLTAAIAVAAATAALLPVQTRGPDGSPASCTLPGLVFVEGLPVGMAYVMYHLTAGGFLLVVLLLAPDPSSSPLTRRGHLWFGAIIGFLTVFLRIAAGLPAAAYWALLGANTLVPTINRLTRRRVFGT